MDGKWGTCSVLGFLLSVMVGCRTPQPNLKPVETPETLNPPPQEARFNSPGLPKEAFNRDDASKRWRDLNDNNNIMQAGRAPGSFGGPSSGMMR